MLTMWVCVQIWVLKSSEVTGYFVGRGFPSPVKIYGRFLDLSIFVLKRKNITYSSFIVITLHNNLQLYSHQIDLLVNSSSVSNETLFTEIDHNRFLVPFTLVQQCYMFLSLWYSSVKCFQISYTWESSRSTLSSKKSSKNNCFCAKK